MHACCHLIYSASKVTDYISYFALLSTSDKVHPQLLAWLLSWKISVLHRTAEGNDVTCSFNLDSWWKHHLDLNYPGRFFLALSRSWKARGDSSLIFLFLPKPLQCVRGGHNVSSVPTVRWAFLYTSVPGTHLGEKQNKMWNMNGHSNDLAMQMAVKHDDSLDYSSCKTGGKPSSVLARTTDYCLLATLHLPPL